jgi:hypothetical protein
MRISFARAMWVTAVTVASVPSAASAVCAGTAAELVWSYPAAGASDVPTDARFWFIASVPVRRVDLDGRVLARFGISEHTRSGFDPGGLARDTDYVVTVIIPDQWGNDVPVDVPFRTSSGPYEGPPPSVALTRVTETREWNDFSAYCQDVIWGQDCYDEGQDLHAIIGVEGNAVAYLVERRHPTTGGYPMGVLWPGDACGSPSVFTASWVDECYRVYAVDPSGAYAVSEEVCQTRWSPPACAECVEPAAGGCASAPVTSTRLPFLLLLALLAIRRRSVRR